MSSLRAIVVIFLFFRFLHESNGYMMIHRSEFAARRMGTSHKVVMDIRSSIMEDDEVDDHGTVTDGMGDDTGSVTSPVPVTGRLSNRTSSSAEEKKQLKGYQRIEDWHRENHNPKHVLEQLKQEKSKWNKKFESL